MANGKPALRGNRNALMHAEQKKYLPQFASHLYLFCVVVQLHDDYVMHFCVRYHRAQWQMIHVWPEMFEFILRLFVCNLSELIRVNTSTKLR